MTKKILKKEIDKQNKVVVCYLKPWEFDVEEQKAIYDAVQKTYPKYNVLLLWNDLMSIEIRDIDEEIQCLEKSIEFLKSRKIKYEENSSQE